MPSTTALDAFLQQVVEYYEQHTTSNDDAILIGNGDQTSPTITTTTTTTRTTTRPPKFDFVSQFVAGATGAFVSRTLTSPLSVCQVQMQTSVGSLLSFPNALSSIYHTTGAAGFWAGNNAALLRIIPSSGIKFALFRLLHDSSWTPTSNTASAAVSGALAGVTSVLLLHPLEVVKIQMVVRSTNVWPAVGAYVAAGTADVGILDACHKILIRDGLFGFYRGMSINLMGVTLLEGAKFATYESLRSWWGKRLEEEGKEFRTGHWAVMGYASGVVSQGLTYPIDVIRRRVITSGEGEWCENGRRDGGGERTRIGGGRRRRVQRSGGGSSSSLLDVTRSSQTARQIVRQIWTEESPRAFIRGAFINKIRTPFSSAVVSSPFYFLYSFFSLVFPPLLVLIYYFSSSLLIDIFNL